MAVSFVLELTDHQVRALAEQVAGILDRRNRDEKPPWLNTARAADYIGAPPSRIHDLVALGKITPSRDGRRLVFRREDLDAYLEGTQ